MLNFIIGFFASCSKTQQNNSMSRNAGVKTSAFSILKKKQKHSHTGSLKEPV
nr:MAG TPA: hypothetical protein [Caudoviricetes sp.]